jgi:hypothetical protein
MVNAFVLSLLLALTHLATGLVTLQTIREITNCTKDCTAEIMGLGLAHLGKSVGIGQVPVLELRNEDEDEIEDVSAFRICFGLGFIVGKGRRERSRLGKREGRMGDWADVDRSLPLL